MWNLTLPQFFNTTSGYERIIGNLLGQFFRPYLYGRKFTVIIDHRSLIAPFSHKHPSSKMTRIRLELSDYDFNIMYRRGANNTKADALFRIELNLKILNEIIPGCIDERERRTLAITRSMLNKNIHT